MFLYNFLFIFSEFGSKTSMLIMPLRKYKVQFLMFISLTCPIYKFNRIASNNCCLKNKSVL